MDTFTLLLDWLEDLDKYLNDDDEYSSPSNDEEAAKLVEEKKLDEKRRKNLDDNLEALNDAILNSVHNIRRQSIAEYDHDDNLQRLHDTRRQLLKRMVKLRSAMKKLRKL
ncbi:unnamed protein product [Phytophthora lilii]|uniref:Unnamed protein product n=1 Tax=Phytophthora lilii TaxID=2077276 RepID=A0A9W6XB68_9STRA|nr:unnamed protein product [Phytophthora lilii]